MTDCETRRRHVAACAVCAWLLPFAIRRRDPMLLDAAIRLREEHARADAERTSRQRKILR